MAKRRYSSPIFLTVSTLADVTYGSSNNDATGGTDDGVTSANSFADYLLDNYGYNIDSLPMDTILEELGLQSDAINESSNWQIILEYILENY